jgi:mannose/fructose/N-acetylgalactosamine-specific phosphotransferase system component IIC
MNMFLIAFLACFAYWLLFVLDETFGFQTLTRPIVVGPVVGLLMGDLRQGIIMGGLIESIYMGIVNSGGASPADAFSATVICTTFVIKGGMSTEAALAFALPIGTIMQQSGQFAAPVHLFFSRVFDKWAETGQTKKYETFHFCYRFIFSRFFQILVLFAAIAVGVDNVQNVMNALPPFVLTGLQAAGRMLPAVGMGILLSMVWSKDWGAFLIIGYVLVVYLKLNSMAVALLGVSIAVIVFFLETQKASGNATGKPATAAEEEEEFFK